MDCHGADGDRIFAAASHDADEAALDLAIRRDGALYEEGLVLLWLCWHVDQDDVTTGNADLFNSQPVRWRKNPVVDRLQMTSHPVCVRGKWHY